jgi:hypothetical protein
METGALTSNNTTKGGTGAFENLNMIRSSPEKFKEL